jgi:oligosaccharyl transferase STT3 subunit
MAMGRAARGRPGVLVALAIIVLAGAGLRGWQAAHPRLAHESVDERVYAALARTLAEDGHYGDRSSGQRHPFIAAPGAPFAFAAARRVTPAPPGSPTDIRAAYWLLAVVGTVLIVATFALGRRLGGDGAGLAAAAVVALYPPLVRTTGELLSEPFGALLVTLALLALVAARDSGRRGLLAAGGVLLGLTALARADLLVALLVCPIVLLLLAARSGRTRYGAVDAATVLGAGVLILAPWVAYASLRSGEFVPVVETGGPTLLVGAYLPGDGTTAGFKRSVADETRARVRRLRGVSDQRLPGAAVLETVAARRPDLGYRDALRTEAFANVRRYALGRPGAFAAMMARKAVRMWRAPSQVRSRAAVTLHRLVVVLALAGLLCGVLWGRRGDLALVIGVLLASTLLHAVLVAHPRYALTLIGLLAAGGAAGIAAAWSARAAGWPSARARAGELRAVGGEAGDHGA